MNKVIAGIGLAVCLAVAAPSALARVDAQAATQAPVSLQLLAINDYHGNIEPPGGTLLGQPAGGAEYLATHIGALKAQNPNTIVVGAGDLIRRGKERAAADAARRLSSGGRLPGR